MLLTLHLSTGSWVQAAGLRFAAAESKCDVDLGVVGHVRAVRAVYCSTLNC